MVTRVLVGVFIGTALVFALFFNLGLTGWDYPAKLMTHPIETDFALYYRDARIVIEHGWRHLGDPVDFAAETQRLGIIRPDPPVPSLYPPLQTALVIPFAVLPLPSAYLLWLATMLACLLLTVVIAAPRRRLTPVAALALAVGFNPVPFGWAHGQVIFVVMLAVVAAWALVRKNRQIEAGLVLTLILLKPYLASLVPVALLAAGRWRALVGFAAGVIAVAAGYLLTLPLDTIVAYVARVASASQHPTDWRVPQNLTLVSLAPGAAPVVEALIVALVLVIAFAARRNPQRDALASTAALVGSLYVSPYVHYQDLVVLLVGGWLVLRGAVSSGVIVLLALGYLAVNIEVVSPLPGPTRAVALAWLGVLAWIAIRRSWSPRPVATPVGAAA